MYKFEDEGFGPHNRVQRTSDPDEYPNFPDAPDLPDMPSFTMMDNVEPAEMLELIKKCVSYMKQVHNFIGRLTAFVGEFKRMDGLQEQVGGLGTLIESRSDVLAGDISNVKEDIANFRTFNIAHEQ